MLGELVIGEGEACRRKGAQRRKEEWQMSLSSAHRWSEEERRPKMGGGVLLPERKRGYAAAKQRINLKILGQMNSRRLITGYLPPGHLNSGASWLSEFRFHLTDEELRLYYLKRNVSWRVGGCWMKRMLQLRFISTMAVKNELGWSHYTWIEK
ncbi:hypothetical protein Droror1_Dr00008337, partial [Drosera rotundifolia]